MELVLGKARVSHVPRIHSLINGYAEKGEMLARSLNEIYENLRDYFVITLGEEMVGCASCHIHWADLAEIKSLAVASEWWGKGIATRLVRACIREAQELGINTIFALTYKPEFFERLSFRRVEKSELPHKVWSECIRCPKFPDCGEVAVVYSP